MRYHTEGEVSVVMATKLSSVPMLTENLAPKSSEGRRRRDRKWHAEYGMYLTHCILGNFSCFFCRLLIFFSKLTF